jgi:hypothetical protein
MQTIFDSVGGRKMLLGVLGIVAVTILAALKAIDGPQALDAIKWIILGVAGALAVSDIGTGIAATKAPPASTTTITASTSTPEPQQPQPPKGGSS